MARGCGGPNGQRHFIISPGAGTAEQNHYRQTLSPLAWRDIESFARRVATILAGWFIGRKPADSTWAEPRMNRGYCC